MVRNNFFSSYYLIFVKILPLLGLFLSGAAGGCSLWPPLELVPNGGEFRLSRFFPFFV
jgi:hypothetical protein